MTVTGVDVYNFSTTGGVAKTLNCAATDSDHVPCVLIFDARGNGGGRDLSHPHGRPSEQGDGLHRHRSGGAP